MMFSKSITTTAVALLILLACFAASSTLKSQVEAASQFAGDISAKLDPRIAEAFEDFEIQRVIVAIDHARKHRSQYDVNAGREQSAQRRKSDISALSGIKKGILSDLSRKSGLARTAYELPNFGLMVLDVDRLQLETLAEDERVSQIWFNDRFKPMLDSSVPYTGADSYHGRGYGGAGTSVAVIDGPVKYWNGHFGDCDQVGAETCSIKAWENFTNQNAHNIAEGLGHGSNVAGIVLGMAPESGILSLNVFKWFSDQHNYMADGADILAALDWVAEHAESMNIVAVNMSLGSERNSSRPCNDDPRFEALATLWEDYGVAAAIASGNEAQHNSLGSPACISVAVSVGAQYDDDLSSTMSYSCIDLVPATGKITCYANLNGALDIVAPGINITAGGYNDYSGTSMAAPHVAGALALMQSYWKEREGLFKSAFWADRYLQFMAAPLPNEGYTYKSLNFGERFSAEAAQPFAFPAFLKGYRQAAIPGTSGSRLEMKLNVAGGPSEISGAYLHLEIIHPSPEQVTVTLTSPDGSSASTALPSGQANFNSVLGREYFPGIFSGMHGGTSDGEWLLELQASRNLQDMYYLSATLWLKGTECTAECSGRECGDDGCGGSCGECQANQVCNAAGECLYNDEFCKGDTCRGAQIIEIPTAATLSGNTRECSDKYEGGCCGMFTQDKVYRMDVERDAYFHASVGGFKAGLYIRKNDCASKDLVCAKPDGDTPAEIETVLKPGTYYLFVDGYSFEAGEFQLEIDVCSPDCTGRECGSDGCGGSCGDSCPEERECNEAGRCACPFEECDALCCAENEVCADKDCCLPECNGRECGEDGCGGSCGECPENSACGSDGLCIPDENEINGDAEEKEADGDSPTPDGDGGFDIKGSGDGGCNSAADPLALLLILLPAGLAALRRRFV